MMDSDSTPSPPTAAAGANNTPLLYEGERLETSAGYPTLYKFLPSSSPTPPNSTGKKKPLIVFIPGAAHLARIAYGGHAGYDPRNFLAYWLNEAGYDVLAISYPLETKSDPAIVAPDYPDFRVPAWGEQAARTTRMVLDEGKKKNENGGLGNGNGSDSDDEVILLAWSMGGKILKPFVASARECGFHVKLFVALAATPGGITGLRAYPRQIRRTENGYATCAGFDESFLRQIHEQWRLEQEQDENVPAIIDDEVFLREYIGYTPVRLTSWGLTYPDDSNNNNIDSASNKNTDESGFIPDEWEALRDAGPTDKDIRGYPFIGSIRPTSILDMRHTLCDSANWGMILTLKLTADVTKALSNSHSSSPSFSSGSHSEKDTYWQQLTHLIHSAPAEMTTETVHGTHFFFLGRTGARETAEAIVRLIEKMERIQGQMEELVGKLCS
ncbi:hypothetical protein VTN77DRAFT_1823 [Rasamsonia byssochlamydoides]|uniref:uncharacterized protein n=1 Tax=Rasamsonia byssochlamydoides TaxID=89139 RepID=UPI003744A03A